MIRISRMGTSTCERATDAKNRPLLAGAYDNRANIRFPPKADIQLVLLASNTQALWRVWSARKETTMSIAEIRSTDRQRPHPWNKGRLIGQKRPLKPKDVWAIRVRLEIAGNKISTPRQTPKRLSEVDLCPLWDERR
jgi:hypothetical protein